MARHSSRSPSTAHRWMRCYGAPNAEAGMPDPGTEFAAQGTLFHEVAAFCLDLGLEPENFLGLETVVDGHTVEVDEDMVRFMRRGLDRVREFAEGHDVWVEKWVDLEPWLGEGEGGTADVGIVQLQKRRIIVFDWKYGQGVPVSPVENEQLQLYALGFWQSFARFAFDFKPDDIEVLIIIEQPRAPGGGGDWTTNVKDLLAFGERARLAQKLSRDRAAPRQAGEKQCQFCKAKGHCGELARFNLSMVQSKFEDLDDAISMDYAPPIPPVGDLTPERRSFIARHAKLFTDWLDEIHATVLTDGLHGRPTPGLKVVKGRQGKRVYTDPDAVMDLFNRWFMPHLTKRVPVSPAQAEKKLDAQEYKELAQWITQSEPKPVLVPEWANGEAIKPHGDKFEDEDATALI